MEGIGHSSLLKFVVADNKLPTMSEANINIGVPLDNSNIKSTVPEEQKLRETLFVHDFTKVSEEYTIENASDIVQNTPKANAQHDSESKDDSAKMAEVGTPDKGCLITQETKEDFTLSPVITVTKEEAVFTKGDLKLQRVSVTEDISQGSTTPTMVEEENVSVIKNGEPEIRSDVFKVQQLRTETQADDQTETKRPKTRIPTLRFRQAVDQLKRERKSFEDKKEPETPPPTPVQSAIPRLKNKSPASSITAPQNEKINLLPRLSDEFDRLYDEISEDQESLDNLSIISKIEDPVKLDNTFEEIIHAYEENEIQSSNVEKVRQSKIPLLKRKSEHEIEVPKQTSSVFRQSVSVDLSKIKSSSSTTENHSRIQSVTLNRSPIRTSLISKRISEMKSVQDSSSGYIEKNITVNVASVEETNTEGKIIKNEVMKELLNKPLILKSNKTATEKIENGAITTSERTNEKNTSYLKYDINEEIIYKDKSVENTKEQSTFTEKEETRANLVTSTTNSIEKVYSDSTKNMNKVQHIEKTSNTQLTENINEEDILILRGKVNRIIQRMDSKDAEIKQSKRDFEDKTATEKSVLSKIAIFEHSKPVGATSPAIDHHVSHIYNNKLDDPNEIIQDLSNDSPTAIKEVLKTLPAGDNEENVEKDSENDVNKIKISTSNPNSPTTKLGPTENQCTTPIEIIDIQPLISTQSVEPVESNLNVEENVYETDWTAEREVISKDKDTFNIEIVDIQPKVQTNDVHGVYPLETELNYVEKSPYPMNIEKKYFGPTQLEREVPPPTAIYNNKNLIYNDQYSSLNINGNGDNSQEIDEITPFIKKSVHSKAERNIVQEKQYNMRAKEDCNVYKPVVTNNKPQIVSDIIKQEVKYDHMKVNEVNNLENEVFHRKTRKDEGQLRIHSYRNFESDQIIKSKSLAELDIGLEVKGRVKNIIVRMKSLDKLDAGKKDIIDVKERPRKKSVLEKIALFERKLSPIKLTKDDTRKIEPKEVQQKCALSEEEYAKKIEELALARTKYGAIDSGKIKYLEFRDGGRMPAIGIGTALLDPKLTRYVVQAAIDLGYRTIDTAYIYGNEKEVGEAINEKIRDGTVTRSELFIISKLWSTFHRQDLVERACRASLDAMGLDYFDLYLIHNPMSFKEGRDPIPKIASVIQFSSHDYLDAWFGVERLVREGLVKRGGVSNFNSVQVDRVVEKGKIKPAVNQVECHPYLSQNRLDDFCQARNVKLCCFGVLGSKGTPVDYKSALPPAIDDPLVRVMAAGLDVSPAALLISYQLALDRGVIVKASSAGHLWDNLQALTFIPSAADISALHALNKNKRTFTFKGMGDTHRNYPFNIPY